MDPFKRGLVSLVMHSGGAGVISSLLSRGVGVDDHTDLFRRSVILDHPPANVPFSLLNLCFDGASVL